MAVRLAALQAAVAVADRQGRLLQRSGHLAPAEAVYETTLAALHALLETDVEVLRGWWRVAYTITDTSHRLLLDALTLSPFEQFQTRITSLLDLPDIGGLTSLNEMHEVATAAIGKGAPRYNGGDIRGCCLIYWSAIQVLGTAPVLRGFPGYARAMGLLRPMLDGEAPPAVMSATEIDQLAWHLRQILDGILQMRG